MKNITAKEFFNNAITFPIPHDYLHELLIEHSYFDNSEPTYKKILIGEVDVSMDKFKALSFKDKFNITIEEVMIMSLEGRYPIGMFYKERFALMLKKFILSHCKIEQAVWILENHKYIMRNIPFNYVDFMEQKLKIKL